MTGMIILQYVLMAVYVIIMGRFLGDILRSHQFSNTRTETGIVFAVTITVILSLLWPLFLLLSAVRQIYRGPRQ